MNIETRNINENLLIKRLNKFQQAHVLYFLDELGESEKDKLIKDLSRLDINKINSYYKQYLSSKTHELILQPTGYLSRDQRNNKQYLKSIGEKSLKNNEVAFLTVAGGQGSRLGYEHPKGCFQISPIKNKSLFQIFAEKIKFYSDYYKNNFNWYIMTSDANYQETLDFFSSNNFFNLDKKQVLFFKQGMLPTLTMKGKFILKGKGSIFLNPDGHGGTLKALLNTGLLKQIIKSGVKHLSYFQVDNPLVNMADPYFIGYHIEQKSQVSSKVIKKLYPEEKLGIICKVNNANRVVEYSDISDEITNQKNENGQLKYLMGSIAIHIFDVKFLKHFTKRMPIHYAVKKVLGYDFNNEKPMIKEMDGIKFETFIFDSIPKARRSIFFETEREVEFFPLKNKTGVDSIDTCINGQNKLFFTWLKLAGLVNFDYNDQKVEISPLYAPDINIFLEKAVEDTDKLKKAIYNANGSLNNEIYIE